MALMVKDKIIYGSIKEVPSFGFTPVGTVIAVMGNTAPNHYLICNGQEVSIKSYPELALYFNEQFGSINHFGGNGTTTFCVPDLRGEFLRGTGINSHTNQGSGTNVGEHQDATEHLTIENDGSFLYSRQTTSSTFEQTLKKDSSIPTTARHWRGGNGNGGYTVNNFGLHYTSRPTNTSVLYCIAVHDIYVDARYNYSLEEQIVGRWIDGKPLYQKTWELIIPNLSGGYKFTEAAISDLDEVISTQYSISKIGQRQYVSWSTAHNVLFDDQLSSGVEFYFGGTAHQGRTMFYTCQYTKTTD